MNITTRTSNLSISVVTWMRSHVRFVPERRRMNYFGQPAATTCCAWTRRDR
jgi:hypothetical protein